EGIEANSSTQTSYQFIFSSVDPLGSAAFPVYGIYEYLCSLNGGPFSICNAITPHNLAEGQQSLLVQAVDFSGNTSQLAGVTSWFVALTPPVVTPPTNAILVDDGTGNPLLDPGVQTFLTQATANSDQFGSATILGAYLESSSTFASPSSVCPQS